MDADDITALDVALLTGNSVISNLLLTHGARAHISSKSIVAYLFSELCVAKEIEVRLLNRIAYMLQSQLKTNLC